MRKGETATSTGLPLRIYKETIAFLDREGLLDQLQSSLSLETIDDRMDRIDPASCGLEMLDAVHCVVDEKRTLAFMNAIERAASPGDVVVEAGMGTGILAVMAAALGAKVYGVEINRRSFELACRLVDWFEGKDAIRGRINLIEGDASEWVPPSDIDVLISENIYAGMFYEMQIPIVNHMLSFLSPSGRVIPQSMESHVILAQTRLPEGARHGQMISPSLAEGRAYSVFDLSSPAIYQSIDFSNKNGLTCESCLDIPVQRDGAINSLLIYSQVSVAPDIVLRREDMIFMGEDALLVIDPPVEVVRGYNALLMMRYDLGGKPESGQYELKIIDFS